MRYNHDFTLAGNWGSPKMLQPSRSKIRRVSRGFTLLELLAVLVIIGIIIAVAVPLMRGSSKGLQIGSSAEILKSELLLARQQAITMNGTAEMRFFQKTASDPYTACQIFTVNDDGTKVPFSKLRNLPEGLGIASDAELSPMLEGSVLKGTQTDGVPAVKDWNYAAIAFKSSGQVPDVAEDKAFVTLLDSKAPKVSGNLPANYAVIRVQTLTGIVSVTRP